MAVMRRRRPDRLRVHLPGAETWRAELPHGTLARRFVAPLEGAAELRWEMAGGLDLGELRALWPAAAPLPTQAYLTRGGKRAGDALHAEYPAGGDGLEELGNRLREALLGIEAVADDAADAADQAPSAVLEAEPVDAEFETAPGAPGGAVPPAAATDGPFALPAEDAADADADEDRRVSVDDLAWLNPGDLLVSPRRGRLRVKRVEDEARQVLARSEAGELLALGFDELVGEFSFED